MTIAAFLWTVGLSSAVSVTAWAQGPAVLTQHNDNNRSGANLTETTLGVSAVNSDLFAKFSSTPVRGSMYAQPLYVPNVNCPTLGTRNLVYVATMHNHIYALDVTNPRVETCWHRQFEPSIPLPDSIIGGGAGYRDIWGEVGIVSTPVISQADNALYFISTTKSIGSGSYRHLIHKVRLTDGADILLPVALQATGFDSAHQLQRSALLLSSGVLYASFSSYGDNTPYNGWVFAFDSSTLRQLTAFNDTAPTPSPTPTYSPAGPAGGIWMSGQGPAADSSNNIYLMTGNGYFNYAPSAPLNMSVLDLGSTFAKLKLDSTRTSLTAQSWFAPFNVYNQVQRDADLGSSGVLLIPNSNRLVGGGKEGVLYVLDRNSLGYYNANADSVVQEFLLTSPAACAGRTFSDCMNNVVDPTLPNEVHGAPVFWSGPNGGQQWIYVWAGGDIPRAYLYNPTTQKIDCQGAAFPNCNPISQGTLVASGQGATLSLSANGSAAGSGVLWATHPISGDANQQTRDGILRAFDASNLGHELWNSTMHGSRDTLGALAKFVAPTVSAGHVTVPTFAGLSSNVIINEYSDQGPALAPLARTALVLAWKGTDNPSHLNVISTTDGISYGNKATLPEFSAHEPALVGDPLTPKIYLAWTGTDGHLNVAFSNNASFANYTKLSQSTGGGNVTPLAETSDQAPAVAYDSGRIFVAWKGNGNNEMNVMSCPNGSSTFDSTTKVTITTESTTTAPTLVDVLGILYLSWLGTDGALNVLVSTDGGRTFSQKTTLTEHSNYRPAIAGLGVQGSPSVDLHMIWTETNSLLSINTAENANTGSFGYKQTMYNENSNLPPAATLWAGQMFVGWTGTDGRLNVSRYSPGEVVVYGFL